MKICILTQPLETNYGGLLQAYALQTVLKRLGHDVWTEDRHVRKSFLQYIKYQLKILLGPIRHKYVPTEYQKKIIRINTDKFIHEHIRTTEPIFSRNKSEFMKYGFDAYVVGSDQVWRPRYSPYLPNYFLDFTCDEVVKRLAYAASFGTDIWEFSESQTIQCSKLAKKFDAISVREDSGIKLCEEHLGVKAEHVLDPTFLLDKTEYLKLCNCDTDVKVHERPKMLMQYVLDDTYEKKRIVESVCVALGIGSDAVIKPYIGHYYYSSPSEINKSILPSVQAWLKGFADADFVVTDSFHGTVFSIIFNKPFVVIPNVDRGLTRFSSLMKLFDLEDRMIISTEKVADVIGQPIDYEKIQYRLDIERRKSIDFLTKALM